VNPIAAALAVVAVAGAVVALSVRDGRIALVGLLATLVAAPLVSPGADDPWAAAARLVAAVLAAYLLRLPLRDRPATLGSRLGWPAEALAAAAAFLAGAAAHEVAMPGLGPVEATAAGCALLVLAAAPMLERVDVLRLGLGLLLALTGADLVRAGLAGPPPALESIVVAAALAIVGGGIALAVSRTDGTLAPARRQTGHPR
jgi:hypothetical protein